MKRVQVSAAMAWRPAVISVVIANMASSAQVVGTWSRAVMTMRRACHTTQEARLKDVCTESTIVRTESKVVS